MSDESNPYQSPQAAIIAEKPLISQGVLTDLMTKYLKETSPWVRFLGIVSYIACGLIFLTGFVLIIVGFVQAVQNSEILSTDSLSSGLLSSGFMVLGSGFLIFFPARFLYLYGAKLRNYCQTYSEKELELAFKNSKSFWKFSGICTIIYLAFIPVAMVIGIVAAVAMQF
ncbi:MAG: hypothetical protein LBP76_08890 [Treponema sp.]|jgi:hypothetical protein|nr:hypothetical protein [Treponema sp.]